MRKGKRSLAVAHTGKVPRKVDELVCNEMDHFALTLNLAANAEHRGGEQHAAILLENLDPDDDIGRAGLVFHRQEHHALGRAGPLTDKNKAGRLQPASVARLHRFPAGDDGAPGKVTAQERERMVAQGETDMP